VDRTTLLRLNALNRQFYASVADEFSASRRNAWPGFQRVLRCVETRVRDATPSAAGAAGLRVLDVGAGDGRFGAYLRDAWHGELDYLGVDSSRELLAHAQRRALGAAFRFAEVDFVEAPPSAALPRGPFDLIALFGVLHHVPGRQTRVELLSELAHRISQRGVLALTFWRLPEDPRFAGRELPLSRLAATPETALSAEQLEAGDTLLRWGTADAPPRYCHFPDAVETDELLASTGLSVIDRFRSDGRAERLNEYALLARA
jgi:tRNA (uracil-5-)-methyltransferase TRM9